MKTTQKPQREMNIQPEMTAVLELVRDLGQAYGSSYLIRVLKGEEENLREGHEALSGYGSLADMHFIRLRNLISFLVADGYLAIKDKRYGTIDLTEKGVAFLQAPEAVKVSPRQLRSNPYDLQLMRELKALRRSLSEKEGKPAFGIFTNYTLEEIVNQKPLDAVSLKGVPGIGDYKADRYGHLVIQAIERVKEQKAKDRAVAAYKRAHNAAHQEVKAMFEAGLSLEEMADKRGVKESTLKRYLSTLHHAGQINLRPWIEGQVATEELEKGKTYFEKAPNSRLKEAYETLGLDYETLRLCRLYISNVATSQGVLQLGQA